MWYMILGGLIGTVMIVAAFALGVLITERRMRSMN